MAKFDCNEMNDLCRLCDEVWELGLAVLSHRGVCTFFKHINKALDTCDINNLLIIHRAAETLPETMQSALFNGSGDTDSIRRAVMLFEEVGMDLVEGGSLSVD